jgi:hypothetical protein
VAARGIGLCGGAVPFSGAQRLGACMPDFYQFHSERQSYRLRFIFDIFELNV